MMISFTGSMVAKTSAFFAASLIIIGFAVFFGSNLAFADTNTAIDNRAPTTNSADHVGGGDYTPVTGVGNGGFDGKYTWAKIYIPIGKSSTITIDQICGLDVPGDGSIHPNVTYELLSLSQNEKDQDTSPGADFGNYIDTTRTDSGGCANNLSFNISASAGIPSAISGHESYRVFSLVATMNNTVGSVERYFRAHTSASGSRIGQSSNARLYNVPDSKAYFGIYSGSGSWNYSVMFADTDPPVCSSSAPNSTQNIKIYDADNGIYQDNMRGVLYQSDRHSSSPNWSVAKTWDANDVQGGAWGSSGTYATLSYSGFDKNHIYKFRILGSTYPNTIQIKLPNDYDQINSNTSLYPGCPPTPTPNSWNVSWSMFKLNRDSGLEIQGAEDGSSGVPAVLGDVANPEGDAPQPGQNFDYIFDAINTGDHKITNIRYTKVCDSAGSTSVPAGGTCATYPVGSPAANHYRGYSTYYHAVNTGYDPPFSVVPPDYNDYLSNTQKVPITKYTTAQPGGVNLYADTGTGVSPNNSIFSAAQKNAESWTPGAGDGGAGHCVQLTAAPSHGAGTETAGIDVYDDSDGSISNNVEHTTSWVINGTATSKMICVYVPWYYTLNADLSVTGTTSGTIQQGQPLTARGTISNPEADGSGRKHTQSIAKDMGIIELKLDSGMPAIANTAAEVNTATGPCNHMLARSGGVTDSTHCTTQGNGAKSVAAGASEPVAGGRIDTDTSNYAVGTKLCYASYVSHPRNTTSDEFANGDSYYTYSDINCTIIVKSPKVHFQNTDVTVGRHRSTVNNPCSDPINASIVTSGAPTIKENDVNSGPRNGNMYGSWVEYGAFATGNISSFGSAAMPYGFTIGGTIQPSRLTFGNDGSLGNFAAYGQTLNCLPNPFEDVNDDNTTDLENLPTADAQNSFETAGANKGNLYLNELAEKTTASSDKKGYVAKGSNIRLTPRSPTTYTADVSVEAKPYLYGAECPRLNVTVYVSGVVTDSKPLDYCNDTNYETQTVTLGLGSVGYGGPSKVRLEYVNDYWTGGDRNIEVRNVNVKFNNNNTQQAHNVKDLPVSNRVYDNSYPSLICESPGVVTAGNGLMLHQSSASSAVGRNGACYGVEIFRSPDLPNIASMPPPPNLLNSAYTGFQSRDMVLYAKKADPTKKCTDVANASSGNIVIDQDIIYSRTGFNSVLQLPRLAFVADCSITISDAVREVNASLVAGDAIKTCSHQAKTKDECNQNLVVRGGISANRLLLWRTFGADLQNDDGAGTPAENFDLSPSQMIANYKRGLRSATFSTTSESDLPPRY